MASGSPKANAFPTTSFWDQLAPQLHQSSDVSHNVESFRILALPTGVPAPKLVAGRREGAGSSCSRAVPRATLRVSGWLLDAAVVLHLRATGEFYGSGGLDINAGHNDGARPLGLCESLNQAAAQTPEVAGSCRVPGRPDED